MKLFLLLLASPRSDRPKFYGRREGLLAIVSRGKFDPSLTVYTVWFRIRSAACPLHYIAASEKSPSRGASIHVMEHKVQTLSQQSGLSQGLISNRSKKP